MIKPLLSITALLLLSACVSTTTQATSSAADISQLSAQQSAIIVYRLADTQNSQAINISINGELLASLSPNAKAQTTLCATPMMFTALYTGQDTAYLSKIGQQGQRLEPSAGHIIYIRIESVAGQALPQARVVDSATATAEISAVSKTSNTISRLSPSITCQN